MYVAGKIYFKIRTFFAFLVLAPSRDVWENGLCHVGGTYLVMACAVESKLQLTSLPLSFISLPGPSYPNAKRSALSLGFGRFRRVGAG